MFRRRKGNKTKKLPATLLHNVDGRSLINTVKENNAPVNTRLSWLEEVVERTLK